MTATIPTWQTRALCRTEGQLEDFFPETPAMAARAKAVCARCEVAEACLSDALARGEAEGVWGGQTAAERLSPIMLAEATPAPHIASRGCYVGGCTRPECRAANTAYNASLRARTPATAPSKVETSEQLEIGVA